MRTSFGLEGKGIARRGCALCRYKTVRSIDTACHTWVLLRWGSPKTLCYVTCPLLLPLPLPLPLLVSCCQAYVHPCVMVMASTAVVGVFVTPAGRVRNVTYHTQSVKIRCVVAMASVWREPVSVRPGTAEFTARMVSTSIDDLENWISRLYTGSSSVHGANLHIHPSIGPPVRRHFVYVWLAGRTALVVPPVECS